MAIKIGLEILVLWIGFAVYMAIFVGKKGPVGAAFFYPKEVQQRVVELGLITEAQLKKRRNFAYILLVAGDFVIPLIMIVYINGAASYRDCVWQFYILFIGQELFDWLAVDTFWVTMSSWWIIPGTEDLLDTWHDPKLKAFKMPKLLIATIPIALIFGGAYYLIGMLV